MKRVPITLIAFFALLFCGVLMSAPVEAQMVKKSTLTGEILSATVVAPFGTNDRVGLPPLKWPKIWERTRIIF